MLRIYNDWLKGFLQLLSRPAYRPSACLPYGDNRRRGAGGPYRVAKLGLRGLELSCSWDMEPIGWHPMWEPLWKAVNDVQLAAALSTPSRPLPPNTIEKHGGRVGRSVFFTVVSGFQMNLVNILAAIIGANVLERYPHIRIAFGESGCGWIP